MNEKDKKKMAAIMDKVLDFKMSKYQSVYLTHLAFRRYEVKKKKKKESMEESATRTMKHMPEICSQTDGLKHKKNVVETAASKSLEKLEEELHESNVKEELLRGDVIEDVVKYLIKD